ncbi:antitermination regulator, partial [Micromonospora sp. M61]|nr:antitermination regulator [Micromonospora sp. M61]
MNLDTREPVVQTLGVLETAALLRELTAGLIALTDFDEALLALVRVTRDAVAGVRWCGFTALRAGEPAGVAASDERLAGLDDL